MLNIINRTRYLDIPIFFYTHLIIFNIVILIILYHLIINLPFIIYYFIKTITSIIVYNYWIVKIYFLIIILYVCTMLVCMDKYRK